ncbi:MAG: [acyl-carrier-protein] S-malonyltransferase [Deltaproteobacteria bacterium]|nr:[acyl-carrier-protein] S-malonyltransferase [Deltaproteobacteria bacterium]
MSRAVALLFPGQGSQAAGMGQTLARQFPVAARTFAEADEALGMSLSTLCFEGPDDDLKLTTNAQPAIVATSIAVLRVLQQETGVQPTVVAGHSLGEYSALVAAGALTLADALRVVRERGRLMQEAVPVGVGAMAAIFNLSSDEVLQVCTEAAQGEVVSPANLNGGGQIVVAGHASAVRRAMAVAKSRGAKRAVELAVSAPFHCALMTPAAEGLARVLGVIAVSPLLVPVIVNVTADMNQDPMRVKDLLVQQVTAPVRWEESMLKLKSLGCAAAIEVGPGKVLAGLLKRIVSDLPCVSVSDPATLVDASGVLA